MWTVYTGVASYEKVQQYAKIRIGGRDMEIIKRDIYLIRLIERRENGLIKVVTGIPSTLTSEGRTPASL